ncbi:MAG: calcium-binding protein, partial [Pseudomonadota bacterium]
GKDTFAFRLLLDAQDEILEKHTRDDGTVNWRKVAGENGDVHLHWVAGIGNDTILDYSKQDGDKIDIRGHTVEIASIKYGEDAGGDYSLITLRSQQGKGGGAHDEDPLGTVKVYGDKVTKKDITLKAKVFYGIDQLEEIAEGEAASPANNTPPDTTPIQWGPDNPETINLEFIGSDRWDKFYAGSGSQTIYGNGGRDKFISMADQGEPDPAQTNGAEGRVYDPLPPGTGDDVFYGGAGADEFRFHALLNATPEVLGQHTREDGKVNWRKVAGENDDVHGHWVEGIGNETIGDFSKSDGDKIVVRGHTVEIASVTHGSDAGGAYSLITVRSQQGNGGAGGANTETGAHDEDPLGTIKVYGDKVFKRDIKVEAKNVFDGMEKLQQADALADFNGGVQQFGTSENGASVASAPETLKTRDIIEIGSGAQTVNAGAGHDRITVYADAGEPDPAQTDGAVGRVDPPIDPALTKDIVSGGTGRDVFTFNMLLDATDVVLARYTQSDGSIKWRKVAGENEKVHDHWVAGGGDDELHDFSKEEKDQIILRGHTVEIADIDYGSDAKG